MCDIVSCSIYNLVEYVTVQTYVAMYIYVKSESL